MHEYSIQKNVRHYFGTSLEFELASFKIKQRQQPLLQRGRRLSEHQR